MSLVLDSLRLSIESLDRALAAVKEADAMPGLSEPIREALRGGVIQAFEVGYEQSWKMMKRWIEMNVGADAVDGVTRQELFRRAAESRLIADVALWMSFHKSRNTTSHTYDATTASEVFAVATPFLKEAKALLTALEARNA